MPRPATNSLAPSGSSAHAPLVPPAAPTALAACDGPRPLRPPPTLGATESGAPHASTAIPEHEA
eukprot:5268417-Lingulodinium_polyedra.AAC.1